MIKFLKRLDYPKIAVYLIPILFWAMVLGIVSCAGNKRDVKVEQEKTAQAKHSFVLPAIPTSLTDPAVRAEYLAAHYWDNFDFADTVLVKNEAITEQAFVDYIDILPHIPKKAADTSIRTLLQQCAADSAAYNHFTELFEKYLYEPNSPMRNEELYFPVVEYMFSDNNLSETEKIRPAYVLAQINKNRMGTKGADFSYTTASGKTGRLYGLKTDYTLVFFNNPDCHACREIKEIIKTSPLFTELLQTGKLTILAFYSDEDLSLWRKHLSEIPADWINSYDATGKFKEKAVYDLRAIPSLYLLDKNKTVLLKDATVGQVEAVLQRL